MTRRTAADLAALARIAKVMDDEDIGGDVFAIIDTVRDTLARLKPDGVG